MRIAFVLLSLVLAWRLWPHRKSLPCFWWFLLAGAVVNLVPAPQSVPDPQWHRWFWSAASGVFLLWRGVVCAEAFTLASARLMPLEQARLFITLLVLGCAPMPLVLAFPAAGVYGGWLMLRQCLQCGMALWACVGLAYVWQTGKLSGPSAWHLGLVSAWMTVQAATGMFDPRSGILPAEFSISAWRMVDTWTWGMLCALLIIWLVRVVPALQRATRLP